MNMSSAAGFKRCLLLLLLHATVILSAPDLQKQYSSATLIQVASSAVPVPVATSVPSDPSVNGSENSIYPR